MSRPALEVADIFRSMGETYWSVRRPHLSPDQRRAVAAILACRTSALGGHLDRCDGCEERLPSYNSCRNRHCPKCQGAARERWVAARMRELLPAPYFHVVFTLPAEIADLALRNKREVYGLLFGAAWETIKTIAADPRHLGAEVGMLAVLHTWGQKLTHHPHLHCVVPGGGLSLDGARWVSSREDFFVSVHVLSRFFRGRFLELLEEARAEGRLRYVGKVAHLEEAGAWRQLVAKARAVKWEVHANRPFGGPAQILSYLGRYTHKVAITNWRLVSHEGGLVRFRYLDRRDGDTQKVETLREEEFARRYLLHVLPGGFQRLRQYGLLANSRRRETVPRCRELIAAGGPEGEAIASESVAVVAARDGDEVEEVEVSVGRRCPRCGTGRLRRCGEIEAGDPLGIGAKYEQARAPPGATAS